MTIEVEEDMEDMVSFILKYMDPSPEKWTIPEVAKKSNINWIFFFFCLFITIHKLQNNNSALLEPSIYPPLSSL